MEQRIEKRVTASGKILLAVDDIVMRADLYNLSVSGCMVDYPSFPGKVGAEVEVTFMQGVVVHGNVTWIEDNHVGIEFQRSISPVTVNYFRLTDWKEGLPVHSQVLDRFGRQLEPLPARRA